MQYTFKGGSFTLCSAVALLLLGIPGLHIELKAGQHFPQQLPFNQPNVFGSIAPVLRGLGHTAALLTFLIAVYHSTYISWLVYICYMIIKEPEVYGRCPFEFSTESCHSKNDDYLCEISGESLDARHLYHNRHIYSSGRCQTVQEFCLSQKIICPNTSPGECLSFLGNETYEFDLLTQSCVNVSESNIEKRFVRPVKAAYFSTPEEDVVLNAFLPDLSTYEWLPPMLHMILCMMCVWIAVGVVGSQSAFEDGSSIITALVLVMNALWISRNIVGEGTYRVFTNHGITLETAVEAAIQVFLGTGLGLGHFFPISKSVQGKKEFCLILAVVSSLWTHWLIFGLHLFHKNEGLANRLNKPFFEVTRFTELFAWIGYLNSVEYTPLPLFWVLGTSIILILATLYAAVLALEEVLRATLEAFSTLGEYRRATFCAIAYFGFVLSLFFTSPQAIHFLVTLDAVIAVCILFTACCQTLGILIFCRYSRLLRFPNSLGGQVLWYMGFVFYCLSPIFMGVLFLAALFLRRWWPKMEMKTELPLPYGACSITGIVLILLPTIYPFVSRTLSTLVSSGHDKITRLYHPIPAMEASLNKTADLEQASVNGTVRRKKAVKIKV